MGQEGEGAKRRRSPAAQIFNPSAKDYRVERLAMVVALSSTKELGMNEGGTL